MNKELAELEEVQYKVTAIFGHSELKHFNRVEGGALVSYGYRIDYDENGNETGRTEPTETGRLWYGDKDE